MVYNRLMTYNWQQKEWPNFTFDIEALDGLLHDFSEKIGRHAGMLNTLAKDCQQDAVIELMVAEAIKTSAIESEYLNHQDVMSSVRHNLGHQQGAYKVTDQRAEGIAEVITHNYQHYNARLSQDMLFHWHTMLMKGNRAIASGRWRTHMEPMHIISGAAGHEKVHFEAPPSKQVPQEMAQFINWYNSTVPDTKNAIGHTPIRAAIAHVYFETIHPFEDGNGRIGRVISEKALSEGLGRPVLLSLSQTIERKKKDYYAALSQAQSSNNLTDWVIYFLQIVIAAHGEAEEVILFTVKKSRFLDRFQADFNQRQNKVVTRMLAEGNKGFEGGMSPQKYMAITKTSKATATRDLHALVQQGALAASGGGRSTRYHLQLN